MKVKHLAASFLLFFSLNSLGSSSEKFKQAAKKLRMIHLMTNHDNIISAGYAATPTQPLGPFYPVEFPFDTDNDLTKLGENSKRANGTTIEVHGVVKGTDGKVISNAKVEIWQACGTGRYDHPGDTNIAAQKDPNFQYYGFSISKEKGNYGFRTIFPGPYPASPTWWRPPHIHFLITAKGYKPLVTQLYFHGDSFKGAVTTVPTMGKITSKQINELNAKEPHLSRLSEADQKKLVVPFGFFKDPESTSVYKGRFDLYLEKR